MSEGGEVEPGAGTAPEQQQEEGELLIEAKPGETEDTSKTEAAADAEKEPKEEAAEPVNHAYLFMNSLAIVWHYAETKKKLCNFVNWQFCLLFLWNICLVQTETEYYFYINAGVIEIMSFLYVTVLYYSFSLTALHLINWLGKV